MASWRVAAMPRRDCLVQCEFAHQDGPRAGGNPPRASPAVRREITARAQRAALRPETPAPSLRRKRRSMRSCSAARSAGTSAQSRNGVPCSGLARRALQLARSAGPSRNKPRARAGCAGVVGVNARRGLRVEASQLAHAAPASRRCAARASMRCTQLRRRRRQRRDAPQQRPQVQHGAADQQRHAPRALDLAMQRSASATKRPGGIAFRRLADVDEVVRHARAQLARGLRGADVHAAIDQRGVDAHDLDGQLLRRARSAQRSCPRRSARSARTTGSCAPTPPLNGPAGTAGRARCRRQPRPGGPAVVALVGALGRFHLAQQRIHLRQREPAVRVDGACGRRACRGSCRWRHRGGGVATSSASPRSARRRPGGPRADSAAPARAQRERVGPSASKSKPAHSHCACSSSRRPSSCSFSSTTIGSSRCWDGDPRRGAFALSFSYSTRS